MLPEELKNKAIRGIFVLTTRTVVLYLIKILAFALLGVFLGPAEIGTFLVVSAVRDIFALFSDVGLGSALIQKKEEPKAEEFSTTFYIQEAIVLVIVAFGWVSAETVGKLLNLDGPGLGLYKIILITLVINSFKSIPSVILERKLAFNRQIVPQFVEEVIFNSLVVYLAWRGWGISSYSISILLSSAFGLTAYYIVSPWRPSFAFSPAIARQLMTFGFQFQAKSYLSVVKDQLLTLFLTSSVGTVGIGYWGWAQRYAYSPFRFIVDNVTKVSFPAYSRIQQETNLLGMAIERSVFGVSTLLFPILALMIVLFPGLVQLIPQYGKWQPALVSFYLLCGAAGISAISNILVTALDATGRVRTTLGLMVMWLAATWVLTVFWVAKVGFTGISLSAFLVSLSIVLTAFLVKRAIPFSLVPNVIPAVVGSLVGAFICWLLINLLPLGYYSIILAGAGGGIIYTLVIIILAGDKLKMNLHMIASALR